MKKKKKKKKGRKKSTNQQMSNFSSLYQLQSSISQNRPVQLVPYFVGVDHICSLISVLGTIKICLQYV